MNLWKKKVDDNKEIAIKEEEKDYENMLIWHYRKQVFAIVIVVIVVVALLLVIKIFQKNKLYTNYEVKNTIQMGDVSQYRFYKFADGLLRYSNDGISYHQGDTVVWNQAFEMKNPVIDVCEDYMAIADKNGTDVYIYDKSGQQGLIEMANPILALEVATQGVVAGITKGVETNLIELYDKDGTNIAMGQTALEGDGCPLALSLSNDGTKLAVSYVYLESNIAKTKVIFYNYSDVGMNEVGRIVGGFEQYETSIVSDVEFISNDIMVAFGDDVLTLYSMKQQPSIIKEHAITGQINHVIYNDQYVALLIQKEDMVDRCRVEVYSAEGNIILNQDVDFTFTDVQIQNNMLVFNNAQEMYVMSVEGIKKYQGTIEEGIVKVIPTDVVNEYIIVTDQEAEEIKLK